MKAALLFSFLLVSSHCYASSDTMGIALRWLQTLAPQNIEFTMLKSVLKFKGCKQKEYITALNQPLTKYFVVEVGLDYAKGIHSWGVLNQKLFVKEFSFIPHISLVMILVLGLGWLLNLRQNLKQAKALSFTYQKIHSGY